MVDVERIDACGGAAEEFFDLIGDRVKDPARLLECYYWSGDPGIVECVRAIVAMPPEARAALLAFFAGAVVRPSISTTVNDDGSLTLLRRRRPLFSKLFLNHTICRRWSAIDADEIRSFAGTYCISAMHRWGDREITEVMAKSVEDSCRSEAAAEENLPLVSQRLKLGRMVADDNAERPAKQHVGVVAGIAADDRTIEGDLVFRAEKTDGGTFRSSGGKKVEKAAMALNDFRADLHPL